MIMRKRVFLLIVFLSFIKVSAFSGNTSMPMGVSPMRTYSSRDFKFGNGNYDMSRDYDGNVYFANINGILVYNGIEWTKLYTPNFAKVSHLYATKERNAVIAVGYDNFGKIEVDATSGELKYKSFLPLRGGKVLDSTFENTISINWFFDTLWNSYSNKLAFISNEEYFVLQEDSIVHISKLPEEFYPHSMFSLNSNLYIYYTGGSFYKFDKESFSPVKLPFSFPEDVSINFSFNSDNGCLLFGTDKGLYI
ncbi:MAG TPA: hypothetical protein DDY68_02725 [Porphyromonadaceae bacterium]|nr:hypothetical protein [Porphyromonadaceae bacterium]